MKQILSNLLFATSFLLFCAVYVNAQQNSQTAKLSEEDKDIDIAITANVSARELKYEVVPNPRVEFPGTKERTTVWEADRNNLPKSVEPGVTYRNIGIQLRITSRFADIERIVSEALGEIPISENTPLTNNPVNQTNQNLPIRKNSPPR